MSRYSGNDKLGYYVVAVLQLRNYWGYTSTGVWTRRVWQELRMEARISLLPQPTAVYVKEAAIP